MLHLRVPDNLFFWLLRTLFQVLMFTTPNQTLEDMMCKPEFGTGSLYVLRCYLNISSLRMANIKKSRYVPNTNTSYCFPIASTCRFLNFDLLDWGITGIIQYWSYLTTKVLNNFAVTWIIHLLFQSNENISCICYVVISISIKNSFTDYRIYIQKE
jgi:hypothetical protein